MKKILSLIFFIFLTLSPTIAYSKIVYIDINLILNKSEIGKSLNKQVYFFYFPSYILKFIFIILGKSDIFNKVFEDFVVSNKSFITDTGWKPPYSFKYGIKKTCLWYKREFRIH